MDDAIAEAVRTELERRKLSHRQFAEQAGMTQPQLSNWLAGRKTITTETASRIMAVLGLRLVRSRKRS